LPVERAPEDHRGGAAAMTDEAKALLDEVNERLSTLHSMGVEVSITPPTDAPQWLPCAMRRFFAALASPCQVCSGVRITAALLVAAFFFLMWVRA
jgi:hypothetical protein